MGSGKGILRFLRTGRLILMNARLAVNYDVHEVTFPTYGVEGAVVS